jgi:DNA polymerase
MDQISMIYETVRESLTAHLGPEIAEDIATDLTFVLDEDEFETHAEVEDYVAWAIETAAEECDVNLDDFDGIDVKTIAEAALDAASGLQLLVAYTGDVEDDIAAGRSLADDDGSLWTTTEVVLDFETANPYCDLDDVGSTVYAQHWSTEIICLDYKVNGEHRLWRIGDDVADLRRLAENPAVVFIAHSAGFEKDIWREIMVPAYGLPDIANERWHDTQASAALKAVPLALETLLPTLGLGEKDKEGRALTLSLGKFGGQKWTPEKGYPKPLKDGTPRELDRSPATMQRVYTYCRDDVEKEEAVHQRLGYLPWAEHQVWLLDQTINERGIRLDRPFLAGAQNILSAAREPLIEEFRGIAGFNPTQNAKVLDWLAAQSAPLPDLRKETIGRAVDTLPPGKVRRALQLRQLAAHSSISKVVNMLGTIALDGRAHRALRYHGTGPGRWVGQLFNPLNFPRGLTRTEDGHKVPDADAVAAVITTGDVAAVRALSLVIEDRPGQWRRADPIEVVSGALRHAIIAAPGHKLVVGDFAQIQARLVLALAGSEISSTRWPKVSTRIC